MKIGFLGAGNVAVAIARRLLQHGHEVLLSSRRDPSMLSEKITSLGSNARAVTIREAAEAQIVVLTVPWSEVENALGGLPPWSRRILVDATNPFIVAAKGYVVADLGGQSSSAVVAGFAPGARVVKAFNTILMTNFEKDPKQGGGHRVLFLSGDDLSAKTEISDIIKSLGYAVIDLGSLGDGGRLQQGGGPLAGKDLLMLADWQLKS